jgi:nucleoid-associated protein YgaU
MPTGRWKNLAIASAILIVGIGAAFVFRREHSPESSVAARSPEPVLQPANSQGAQYKPPAEPALAGRIEPYSAAVPTDTPRDASDGVGRSLDQHQAPTDSPLKWQTVRRPSDSEAAAGSQPNRQTVDLFPPDRPTMIRPPAAQERHKIVDGDTLAALARRFLGAEQRQLDLFEYNRDVLATPELLPIGKELRIPPRDFVPAQAPPAESQSPGLTSVAEPASATPLREASASATAISTANVAQQPAAKTYVVQQHDTLPLIARKLYGDIARQQDLIAANRQQLRSPQDLRPGMTLVVPSAPHDGRRYDGLPRPSN